MSASVGAANLLNLRLEGFALLSVPREFIVLIIEALPRVLTVSAVAERATYVHLPHMLEGAADLFEVEAHHALDFAAVDQHEELGFNLGVEVALDFRLCIAIHVEVAHACILINKVLVVLLDIDASGVPECMQVTKRFCGGGRVI